MPEIEQVIENYLLAWNSPEPEERHLLINKVIDENCVYIDSHLPDPTVNRELHCQFLDGFRAKFPDLSLKLASPVNSHHGYFQFRWQIIKSNGDNFAQGSFFGETNEQNQIKKLVGFVNGEN